jgi:T-complex protein 1 subunit delta
MYNNKGDVRHLNINAAKDIADIIRTSLGPRGMDKMVAQSDGEVIITNDGATILKKMTVIQPAAKILVDLAKSQDISAGDGTTTVTIICGSLLKKCVDILDKGIHPMTISESFEKASRSAIDIIEKTMGIPVNLDDHQTLIKAANTSLGSKMVSNCCLHLSSVAVKCIMKILNPKLPQEIDLHDVKVVKKLGGTVNDTEIVDGLILEHKISHKISGAPKRVDNAKICLAQFHISMPKSDTDSSVVVSDSIQMDQLLREERKFILQMVMTIKNSGCNVLFMQKSILRDSVSDIGEHYLAKAGILLVKDIERDTIESMSRSLGCYPVAHIDYLTEDKLAYAALVEEHQYGLDKVVSLTGIKNRGTTSTVLIRGSNKLILEETQRSLHDALCVVNCIVQKNFIVPGGAACEIEASKYLNTISKSSKGINSYCMRAFADALEIIPYTLAENAGLDPIQIVIDLKARHAKGKKFDGINVRKGIISNMIEENVTQPLQVTSSALELASECFRMILKVDDIIQTQSVRS